MTRLGGDADSRETTGLRKELPTGSCAVESTDSNCRASTNTARLASARIDTCGDDRRGTVAPALVDTPNWLVRH